MFFFFFKILSCFAVDVFVTILSSKDTKVKGEKKVYGEMITRDDN